MLNGMKTMNRVMFNQYVFCIILSLLFYTSMQEEVCIPSVSNWTYSYKGTTATFEFTEFGFLGLEFNARGHSLSTFNYYAEEENVFVFKTGNPYSDMESVKYAYLCMHLTRVSDNLLYFYILGDPNSDVTPIERLFSSEDKPEIVNESIYRNIVCSTFCSYHTTIDDSEIRILQKEGTNETLSGEEVLCGACTSRPTCPNITYSTSEKTTETSLSTGEYAAIGCGIGGACIFSAIAAKLGYSKYISKKKIGSMPTEKNGKVVNIEEAHAPLNNNSTMGKT